MPASTVPGAAGIRLGFACEWDSPPERTWSYTPWRLRSALRRRADVVDLGITWRGPTRTALKILGAYRHEGRWASTWRHRPLTQAWVGRRLRAAERVRRPVVTLQIGDLATLGTPYLIYQDLSIDILLEHADLATGRAPHFPGLRRSDLERLAERQRAIYAGAAGVLTMSSWLAEHLVRVTGLAPGRVHVVPPGAGCVPQGPIIRRPGHRRRLLFVGRDFAVKAGPQVVAATALLRAQVDPTIELTVVGPRTWPLPGAVPDGVRFLGTLPPARVAALYAEHDVFIMPSVFEGFGIALVEALAHGLPCVARRACAMPEIVRPGLDGALIDSTQPQALASAIAEVLADDALADAVARRAPAVAAHYSWDRAARDVLDVAARIGIPAPSDRPAQAGGPIGVPSSNALPDHAAGR